MRQSSMRRPLGADTNRRPGDPGYLDDIPPWEASKPVDDQAKPPPIEEWPEARPLRREPPPPEPYPMTALGEVLAPMAKRIQAVVCAPDALCGNSVLANANLAVQPHADIELDGRVMPVSIFLLSVADSGERKTAVDSAAGAPHDAHEAQLRQERNKALPDYQATADAYEAERQKILRDNKIARDARRAALQRLGPKPNPPPPSVRRPQEPTAEGLAHLFAQGVASLGLFSTEAGRMLSGHAMRTETRLNTLAGLSELWDGRPFNRVRRGDGATEYPGRRLCLHLAGQPVAMDTLLADELAQGQGFLSRCLVACPASTVGLRQYVEADVYDDGGARRYRETLATILSRPPPLRDNEVRGELNPRRLRLAPPAKSLWKAFYAHVEKNMGSGMPFAPIRGLASKGAEHALRLAGTLALTSDLDCEAVAAEHLRGGIALTEFYMAEALRLAGQAIATPKLREAAQLLAFLERWPGLAIGLVDIYQKGPSPVRDADSARRAATTLTEHGWLLPITGGCTIAGKHHREAWWIRPHESEEGPQ